MNFKKNHLCWERNSFIPNEHNPGEIYYIYLMLLVVEISELVQVNQALHLEKLISASRMIIHLF